MEPSHFSPCLHRFWESTSHVVIQKRYAISLECCTYFFKSVRRRALIWFVFRKEYVDKQSKCFPNNITGLATAAERQEGSVWSPPAWSAPAVGVGRSPLSPCSLLSVRHAAGTLLLKRRPQRRKRSAGRAPCCHPHHPRNSLQCLHRLLHFPDQRFIPHNLTFNKECNNLIFNIIKRQMVVNTKLVFECVHVAPKPRRMPWRQHPVADTTFKEARQVFQWLQPRGWTRGDAVGLLRVSGSIVRDLRGYTIAVALCCWRETESRNN